MNKKLTGHVSIIIPCKEIDERTQNCIKNCLMLTYQDYEIILLPDNTYEKTGVWGELESRVRIIPTGPLTPGAKRNIGITSARGDICAFIDSDAYPKSDWLNNAVKYLNDNEIAAVGGPGLTPNEDTITERAGGSVLSSFMVGGISRRYKNKKIFESSDIHSCNFVVRKQVLKEVGGWNERYWPGEDTLICLSIRKLGKKMIEASDVVVYHHRRSLFKEHIKQVSRFGLHRGFFAKKFRGNSLKTIYFIPTLLLLFLFIGIGTSFFNPLLTNVLLSAVAVYLIAGLIATLLEVRAVRLIPLVWLGIITTHVIYGMSFLIGLMKSDLER